MRGSKQERILRVLINENKSLSKNELSKRANCTRQWVILLLRKLEKKKLVKGTKIINKIKLMKYWLSIHKKPKRYKEYMIREPLKLLKNAKLEYALTTYQAENFVQKYLFPSRIDVYIKENDLKKWHLILTKNGLYGKGNFRIIISDEHVMYKKIRLNKYYMVSLPQLVIDLFVEGGPCHEAAEMLLGRFNSEYT